MDMRPHSDQLEDGDVETYPESVHLEGGDLETRSQNGQLEGEKLETCLQNSGLEGRELMDMRPQSDQLEAGDVETYPESVHLEGGDLETRSQTGQLEGEKLETCLQNIGLEGRELETPPQNAQFQFEAKPVHSFSPLALKEPALRTALVNAGDYRLYLGGSSINGAFADFLKKEQGLRFGKHSQPYADLHLMLLAASRAAEGRVVDASSLPEREAVEALLASLHLSAAFAQAGVALEGDSPGHEAATGAVFLDIFSSEKRPAAEGNVAMLYVVGPKGEGCRGPKREGSGPLLCKTRFLTAIEELGKRALDIVEAYNGTCPETSIQEVRWCLVSGGVYCHEHVTKVDVAAVTLKGMRASSAKLLVTFTYDDDVFRRADKGEVGAASSLAASSSNVVPSRSASWWSGAWSSSWWEWDKWDQWNSLDDGSWSQQQWRNIDADRDIRSSHADEAEIGSTPARAGASYYAKPKRIWRRQK